MVPRNSETRLPDGQVPRFDLAEQILAEQRKTTAARRRPPLVTAERAVAGPERAAIRRKAPKLDARYWILDTRRASSIKHRVSSSGLFPEQQQIIAEIVARDIEKLCGRS